MLHVAVSFNGEPSNAIHEGVQEYEPDSLSINGSKASILGPTNTYPTAVDKKTFSTSAVEFRLQNWRLDEAEATNKPKILRISLILALHSIVCYYIQDLFFELLHLPSQTKLQCNPKTLLLFRSQFSRSKARSKALKVSMLSFSGQPSSIGELLHTL